MKDTSIISAIVSGVNSSSSAAVVGVVVVGEGWEWSCRFSDVV